MSEAFWDDKSEIYCANKLPFRKNVVILPPKMALLHPRA